MKIVTSYYDFWREDLTTYFIKNTSPGTTITYSLYSIANSVETLVTTADITPGNTTELIMATEGIYSLEIVTPFVAGRAEFPTGYTTWTYSIKYFPTLKQEIISLMKQAICCENSNSGCDDDTIDSPKEVKLYNTQLLLSSTGLYLHLLLSQSFQRDYRSCFDNLLISDSTTIVGLLQQYYADVSVNGNVSSKAHLLRIYIAYVYILLYVIETDIAEYTQEVGYDTSDEEALVDTMFSMSSISSCFNDLNINLTNSINMLDTCYKTKTFGGDGICSDSEFLGMYYGTKTVEEFPDLIELSNGLITTSSIPNEISYSPNTERGEISWIAVPITFSAPFTDWEKVEDTENGGSIGSESSKEFIILKTATMTLGGVEYYVYRFNWVTEVAFTLRLYIS